MKTTKLLASCGVMCMALAIWLTVSQQLNVQNTRAYLLLSFPELSACGTVKHTLFTRNINVLTLKQDMVDQWSKTFHERVNTIIEEQLDMNNLQPQCDAETFAEFLAPVESMQLLIDDLRLQNDDADLELLSRLDIGTVLTEYTRQYECALFERSLFLMSQVADDVAIEQYNSSAVAPTKMLISLFTVDTEYKDQMIKIQTELLVARSAVERVLRLIVGKERLLVIAAETQCLQQASLDIRNAMSLAAEASSCLPRVWNQRDIYRDLPEAP